jgi:hypothetical protein
MPRRVSLPGAAELFRATPAVLHDTRTERDPESPSAPAVRPDPETGPQTGPEARPETGPETGSEAAADGRSAGASSARAGRGTGRVRHDEKITVYVSSEELLELERARLSLRAEHGMAVDRGRIVREALALVIDDLAARGADSELVRRLSQS